MVGLSEGNSNERDGKDFRSVGRYVSAMGPTHAKGEPQMSTWQGVSEGATSEGVPV